MLQRISSRKRQTSPWPIVGKYSNLLASLPMILGGISLIVAFMRYMVIFFETFSIVRSERDQDLELLELCSKGAGRSSPRMQATCMDATAARASPLLLAVLMRSATVFGTELYTLVAQPLQSVTGIGMLTMVGIAPWIAPLKTFLMTQLLRRGTTASTPDYRDDHVVVLTNGSYDDFEGGPLSRAAMRFRGIPQRMLGCSDQVEEGKEQYQSQYQSQYQPYTQAYKKRRDSHEMDAEGFSEITITPDSPERSVSTFLRHPPFLGFENRRCKQD